VGLSQVHRLSTHKDLIVWRKSVALASRIYNATKELPGDERDDLTRQMRRSALAVASNIAEGAARSRRTEFIHFLHIARGSLTELETQVLVAADLRLLGAQHSIEEDITDIGRLLASLIRRLTEQRTLERTVTRPS
jgi:four helix bundle protein